MSEPNNSNVQVIENATRDDGRPGDHLTWEEVTTKGGVTRAVRHEGIAHHRDGDGDWCTEDGTWITLGGSGQGGVTITIRRTIQELPTELCAVIVAKEEGEYIEAVVLGAVWRAREAVLGQDDRWHGVWRTGSGRVAVWHARPGNITPGTWKVADQ